jgi:YggT family protein
MRKHNGWGDNPIEAAVRFIQILAWILSIAIFIRVIISWVGLDPRNPVVVFLHDITEPILAPLRQFLPRLGMLDLSPLLAIILLNLVANAATRLLI